MEPHARRTALTLAVAVAALCGFAPGALAATVTLTPTLSDSETPTVIGHHMAFVAGAGERNAVTVSQLGGAVTIRDAAVALAAPAGCQQVDPHAVTCSSSPGPLTVGLALGDGDDSATLNTSMNGIVVDGGPGNDLLVGGTGDDSLGGDVGNDVLIGNAGDDQLEPGTGSDVLNGGAGTDSAVYSARVLPISVDLTKPSADGATDAPDSLTSIEGAIGGNGKDVLTGDSGPNRLDGNVGADRLVGGAGADDLIGGEGPDQIDAGAGDDTIDLSVFDPAFETGDGLQHAVDGSADHVRCGSGRDIVILPEVTDSVASDCELIAFDFVVLRPASLRVTRRHLSIAVSSVAAGSHQRIWLTVKHGGHTTLLGRSSFRRHAGTAQIALNAAGRKLFAGHGRHRIRIGDGLDPDAGFSVAVGR